MPPGATPPILKAAVTRRPVKSAGASAGSTVTSAPVAQVAGRFGPADDRHQGTFPDLDAEHLHDPRRRAGTGKRLAPADFLPLVVQADFNPVLTRLQGDLDFPIAAGILAEGDRGGRFFAIDAQNHPERPGAPTRPNCPGGRPGPFPGRTRPPPVRKETARARAAGTRR